VTPAFLRYVIILITVAAMGLVATPARGSDQEHECSVPERFYEFEPLLPKTVKALATGREAPPLWVSRPVRPPSPGPPASARCLLIGSRLRALR
jgi:hypothetical protein